jgi:RNA-directed DNA polymerase
LESVIATNQPQDKTTVLQSKLYEAAKADKARRFHALHDKLYLPYIMQSAWNLVRRNNGSAGIDGQTLEDIENYGVDLFLQETAQAVRENTYRPTPVRRVNIPKPDGRLRPLGIPIVRDRLVQAAAKLILEPIFEADFEGCSFGFRPGLGQHDALEAIAKHARDGFRWVVDADIEQFFDNLDHEGLMAALRLRIGDGAMLRLIYRWLKAGYLWEGEFHDTDGGSPQGGVLSPLLANVYLNSFDKAFKQPKSFIGWLTRYADDFVIQCGSEEAAHKALAWANEQISKLKLRIHPTKTRIVNDRDVGFDFLSFHHRRVVLRPGSRSRAGKESYGVFRWPSATAQEKYRAQIRLRIGPPGRLRSQWAEVMEGLRQYVVGWCQYFRHGQSTAVFKKLDYFVCERIARTMARSQPSGKRRRRRKWYFYAQRISQRKDLPRLTIIKAGTFKAYKGRAKFSWRAV